MEISGRRFRTSRQVWQVQHLMYRLSEAYFYAYSRLRYEGLGKVLSAVCVARLGHLSISCLGFNVTGRYFFVLTLIFLYISHYVVGIKRCGNG